MNAFKTCIVVAALTLAACGSSTTTPTFCEDQATARADVLANKVTACPTMKASIEQSPNTVGAACETAYAGCTADDQAKLQSSVACLKALPVCTAAVELTTWAASAVGCQKTLCSASAACITAFSMTATCASLP